MVIEQEVVDIQKTRVPRSSDFVQTVDEMVKKYWIIDCIYRNCIIEFGNLKLKDLEEIHRTRIIRPFIITWGQMQRWLGEAGVTRIFQKLKDERFAYRIEPLRSENLKSIQLKNQEEQIVSLFDELMNAKFQPKAKLKDATNKKANPKNVSYTATSKILHLCCPSLFMMWDTNIRNHYHKYHREQGNDGKDYLGFLLNTKEILNAMNNQVEGLSRKYSLRPTRIIDMYNWAKYSEKKS